MLAHITEVWVGFSISDFRLVKESSAWHELFMQARCYQPVQGIKIHLTLCHVDSAPLLLSDLHTTRDDMRVIEITVVLKKLVYLEHLFYTSF